MGISVWEESVHLRQIPFEGAEEGLAAKKRERYGTGNKDEKSVNGTQISIGKFPPGKRGYLFRNSVHS